MYKNLRIVLLTTIVAHLLSACGGGGGADSSAANPGSGTANISGDKFFPAKFTCSSVVAYGNGSIHSMPVDNTPRAFRTAELLAQEASGQFIAPESVYQRVAAELPALRSRVPVHAGVKPTPCSLGVLVQADDVAAERINRGEHVAWNELVELLNPTVEVNNGSYALSFDDVYQEANIVEEFFALDGILDALPDHVIGDGDDVCLAIRGDKHFYIFDHGEGDCTAGCITHNYYAYETDASGNIRKVGQINGDNNAEMPDWYSQAEDCRVFL